jgi:predicted RNA methylase
MDGYSDEIHQQYATTYGEMTLKGIELLVKLFEKTQPRRIYPINHQTFYDLGSGLGKNVMMVASLVPGIKSKGIELVKERHNKAMIAYNALKNKSKENIEFICGSFFDYNVSDAAWIFISNLCFTDEINKKLTEQLENQVKQNTLIACSVELPVNTFKLIYTGSIPMTWEKNSALYLYKKL